MFTVFTATYNRADTLPRTYASILAQTDSDFEWVVVDDGSEDGTGDLVARWMEEAPFPIRYFWKPNHGKHAAFNLGAREARGELFVCIDSDDEMLPDALKSFRTAWEEIPAIERERFCGLCALCIDGTGKPIGSPFPEASLDSTRFEMRWRRQKRGESFPAYRTDVLLQHPYPEHDGLMNVPPSYLNIELDKKYLTRHVNAFSRIYHILWDRERQISKARNLRRVARGHAMLHAKILNDQVGFFAMRPAFFVLSAVRYVRFSLFERVGPLRQVQGLDTWFARLLWMVGFAPGVALWVRDMWDERKKGPQDQVTRA